MALSEAALVRINDAIMKLSPFLPMERDAKQHVGLMPVLLPMRAELHTLGRMNLNARRVKLRKLLIEDYLKEGQDLRDVDLGYTNTVL